jgi:hypothetical protein
MADFILPVEVLSCLFRGLFLAGRKPTVSIALHRACDVPASFPRYPSDLHRRRTEPWYEWMSGRNCSGTASSSGISLLGSRRISCAIEDVVEGLENAPAAFLGLLQGKNFGLLVKVA